jgi:hypothetical protein
MASSFRGTPPPETQTAKFCFTSKEVVYCTLVSAQSTGLFDGVILSGAVLQAERRISRGPAENSREIPPPAGKSAGVRDDAEV